MSRCTRFFVATFVAILLGSVTPRGHAVPGENQQIITTVAGGGPADGTAALDVGVGRPQGLALDKFGNIFIAAEWMNRVLRVDAMTGLVQTVAGNGGSGFSGDGGPATNATLSNPVSVDVDSAGNLYISDQSNSRIRRVNPAGIISTIAGNGSGGFSGDGGPATSATLSAPRGIAVDNAGNLFIVDSNNFRIRRVDAAGKISTVAGNGTTGATGDGGPATGAGFGRPWGVAVDPVGNIFITDQIQNRVRRVDASGIITTVAGNGIYGFSGDGGAATGASLRSPMGVAVGTAGNLFIADADNGRIRMVDASGTITTVAGSGPFGGVEGDGGLATATRLTSPWGVAADASGRLFIAQVGTSRIRVVNAAGIIGTVAGNGSFAFSGDDGPAPSASLSYTYGVAVDGAGNVFIADANNARVRRVDSSGIITTLAGNGTPGFSGDGGPAILAKLSNPRGVAVDDHGNVFIADTGNQRVRRIDVAGTITTVAGVSPGGFAGDGGPATSARFQSPNDIVVDAAGNLWIADVGNHRIRRVDTTGTINTVAGTGVAGFSGDGGPATSARISEPLGVVVDPGGNLYIADTSNLRIRRVDPAGTITTVAGSGAYGFVGDGLVATMARLATPSDVAIDSVGNLFIADRNNQRIRRVSLAGIISTVAGSDRNVGFAGDGGPAGIARLAQPHALTVDSADNLLIADTLNSRIRRVSAGVGELDGDGDGVSDASDNCAATPNPRQENTDGDAQGDVCDADDDNDTVSDATDNCALTANPGQENADADAQGDVCDPDDDNDTVSDPADNCAVTANPGQENTDGDAQGDVCDADDDNDGAADATDNCAVAANPGQENTDGDAQGDVCDADDDNDGVGDATDNCAVTANPRQENTDGDAQGDVCDADDDNDGAADATDNCAVTANPGQENTDGDAQGDVCDADDDNDGVGDTTDNCALSPNSNQANHDGDAQGDVCDADDDNDGVSDLSDNCMFASNPTQGDIDHDGQGDACEEFSVPVGGLFAIGDLTPHAAGATVNFWGAQWAKSNALSGGPAPSAFKGFASGTGVPGCGSTWTSDPGNSSRPPSAVPTYMAVIVSSGIAKTGSTINGNVKEVVIVYTGAGYGPNPGQTGMGTVVHTLCRN